MGTVTALVPYIKASKRKHEKPIFPAEIKHFPVSVYTEFYERDGGLAHSTTSKSTLPDLQEFVRRSYIGRLMVDNAVGNLTTVQFETVNGMIVMVLLKAAAYIIADDLMGRNRSRPILNDLFTDFNR